MLDRFVAYNARCTGDAVAFASLSHQHSYALLEASVSRVARALEGLRELTLGRVAIQCADTWRHWVLILALGRLGIALASLLDGDIPAEELAVLKPDLVILHGTNGGGSRGGAGRLVLDDNWFDRVFDGVKGDDPSSWYPPVHVDPSAPCRAALASGTGRNMRLLELSYADVEIQLHRLIHNDAMAFFARNAVRKEGVSAKPELLCSIGPQAMSGFLMVGAALAGGTALRNSDARNIGVEVLQAASLMIVMTPVHLEHLLRELSPQIQPVPHVQLTVVGAGLSDMLLQRTRERFTPFVQVVYGTDECGIVAAIEAEKRQGDNDVGPPMPWIELEVVDEHGHGLPAGDIGEIRIRGNGVAKGYLDEDCLDGSAEPTEPAGRERFRQGWFYPGDRGAVSPTGALHLHGRVDELVSIGGAKFDLGELEAILRTEPRIRDVGTFTMEDKQGVEQLYAALVSHEKFDEKALSERLRRRYVALPPVIMIWVADIPHTREGFVDRPRLQNTLRDYIRNELEARPGG